MANPMPGPGEIPANSHFTLLKTVGTGTAEKLTPLLVFEIHHVVDPTSPCFIDAGPFAEYPGLHVTEFQTRVMKDRGFTSVSAPPPGASEADKEAVATAAQRIQDMALLAGLVPGQTPPINVVSSASTTAYPTVSSDCVGPDNQLPPSTCIDDASNTKRLALCKKTWAADPNLYEGTDLVLTAPLNGTNFGFVDGDTPVTGGKAPVGGVGFFPNDPLTDVGGFLILQQTDGSSDPGTPLFSSIPQVPITQVTRDVMHTALVDVPLAVANPNAAPVFAAVAFFPSLGSDDVGF